MTLPSWSQRGLLTVNCLLLLSGTFVIVPGLVPVSPVIAATQQSSTLNNLDLLKQALRTFFQATTFQVESKVIIQAKGDQLNVDINSQTSTLTVLPRRFVSEIKLGTQQYFITSDGETVWIYYRNRDQYTEMTFDAFQDSEDSFFIGLASSFLLEIVRSLQGDKITNEINQSELLAAILQFFTQDYNEAGLSLSQEMVTQEGKEYTRYAYKTNGEDLTLALWIDPQSQELKKLQLLGSEQGIKIDVQENITRQIFNPVVDENSFRFQPSPSIKKVDSLPLEPL